MLYRGALEYFALSVRRDKEEPIIWREGNRRHGIAEVKVSKYDSLDHVDDNGEAVDVNADECATVRR